MVFAGGISVAPLYLVGLGILATEFEWARRLMGPARRRYDAIAAWYGRQAWWVRALLVATILAVGLAVGWFVGVGARLGSLVGYDWPWLDSPLGLGK